MPPTLPILIVGTGISGLALAQGLLKANIPFILFERDPSFTTRSQGYRVRINSTGISALEQLLSPDVFKLLKSNSAKVTSNSSIP
jgi:2-polyprenyl-6-methoxyphenol hydroxylase-like FAD-dependent oxidoreductase